MLTIEGGRQSFCDRVSRRSFLKIGGFAMGSAGSVTLADILRSEAANGSHSQHKALINIYLPGGPSHYETWDPKPAAPSEIRGVFDPIATKVPGIQICELFPKIASMMDRFAVIRSITGCEEHHDGYQCTSGWLRPDLSSLGGRPSIGSVVWKLKGPVDPGVPPHIGLGETKYARYSESGSAGFLGEAYQPFKPHSAGLYAGSYQFRKNLSLDDMKLRGMSLEKLGERKSLLRSLDRLRRQVDASGQLKSVDEHTQTAFSILTSGRLVEALDLSRDDPKVRARYGDGKPFEDKADAASPVNQNVLLARRLVEAGARTVTISYGQWDHHSRVVPRMKYFAPRLDHVVTTLIEDLEQRGMSDDVTVVVWGEFGRTPRINKRGGRDHWPQANGALLAGGGVNTGLVIGATNRLGEHPIARPVHMQQIVSTIYHNLGIDTMNTTLVDPAGRPRYLVKHRDTIPELV